MLVAVKKARNVLFEFSGGELVKTTGKTRRKS